MLYTGQRLGRIDLSKAFLKIDIDVELRILGSSLLHSLTQNEKKKFL